MKKLIMSVLEDMSIGQVNLESEASREMIANIIMATIKTNNGRKGWVLDLSTFDKKPKLTREETQRYKEYWTCAICGEDTSEVDYDYLVHHKLHLGCALKEEEKGKDIKEQYIEVSEDVIVRGDDRRKGDRREDTYEPDGDEVAKALGHMDNDGNFITEDKVSLTQTEKYEKEKEKAMKLIDKSVKDHERNKLSEEIVDDKDAGYIYESPDGGKTVYKRKNGSDERELIKE